MTTKKEPRLKIPPQHLESEQALLGAIMLRPEGVYEIMDIISGESFYAEKHRMIFKSMMELFQKNEPIDML